MSHNPISSFSISTSPSDKPDKEYVGIHIDVNGTSPRKPLALIALVDVSASMDENALSGVVENCYLTRLMLVQHSLKTIVSALEDQDKLAIVTFDHRIRVDLELTNMTDAAKRDTIQIVNSIKDRGATNIWIALEKGIEIARTVSSDYNTQIMLFTDGRPNRGPDIISELKQALSMTNNNFNINSFGYGYDLDSRLLKNIAELGNGLYGYCPDCTMVGTIFINFLASIMTTIEQNAELKIDETSHFIPLQIGRSVNYFYELHQIPNHSISLAINGQLITPKVTQFDQDTLSNEICKFKLMQYINKYITEDPSDISKSELQTLACSFSQYCQTDFIKSLILDAIDPDPNHGQVIKAVASENYSKWGLNYLIEFSIFHKYSICGNFKDESLQSYSNEQFQAVVDQANQLFLTIDPPIPKNVQPYEEGYSGFNMSTLNDKYSGCFDGDAMVSLLSGTTKPVKNLQKGDVLLGGAKVECLVKSRNAGLVKSVIIEGVKFTPYHPILHEGKWVFPISISKEQDLEINYWYNVVLSGGTEIVLNGVTAISLGHGREEDVLKHPYFGTDECIKALKKYPSFESGLVEIEHPHPVRDPTTNLIVSLY